MKKLVTLLSSLFLALALYGGSGKVADISHADLQAAISKKAVTVLDVNGSDSFAEGRIPGAIDFSANGKKLAALLPKDKNALIVAYCGNEYCNAYQAAASAAVRPSGGQARTWWPGSASTSRSTGSRSPSTSTCRRG